MTATQPRFYQIGGSLLPNAPSYVTRRADEELYDGLIQSEFCYVLTARQMGKSSLMVRTAARLRQEGVAVAVLDLTAIGQNLSPEQWYDGLRELLALSLDLEDELEEFWLAHPRLGPLQRFMAALRQVVLPHVPGRLVIFVDEIDAVRSLPFSTDEFFAAIRECYNRRTEDPEFGRLTFCLLGVASPSDLIRDTRTTPFNIGRRIELTDFTEAEALPLAEGLGRKKAGARALLERVLYWTGGHPYLTQRLCQAVAGDETVAEPARVDRLCGEMFLSPGARERDDNLLFVRERLLRSEVDLASLLELYGQMQQRKHVADEEANPLVSVLRLSGVVRVARGELRVRNRIYGQVFDAAWVRANMPDADVRRQRAAFRRGLLRATGIAGVILVVMGVLVFIALGQAHRADRSLGQARASTRQARQSWAHAQRLAADRQVALRARERERDRANREAKAAKEERDRADREAQAARLARAKAEQARQRADENARLAQLQERRANDEAGHARSAAARELAQRQRAQRQTQIATEEARRSRRLLYVADMNVAQQAWEVGNVGRALALLEAHRPRRGQEDLRGFEWRYLWRLCQGGNRATLRGHTDWILSVALSPDGKTVASGSRDHTVRLWDVASQRAVATLTGHSDAVSAVAFSPDSKMLASGSDDHTVKLWDVASQREMITLRGHTGAVGCVAFSPDGRTLASGGRDMALKLWDIASQREMATLRGHTNYVTSVVFSPDGQTLASTQWGALARLWNLTTKRQMGTFEGHTAHVSCAAFSPDGKILATASSDTTIRLWNVATRREVAILRGHTAPVYAVAFFPDGKTLVSGSWDSTLKLWDVATNQVKTTLKGHTSSVWSVALSADGQTLASGGSDNTIRLWDGTPKRDPDVFKRQADYIVSVAFSPDTKLLAVGPSGDGVWLWNIAARHMAGLFQGGRRIALSADGATLAAGGENNTVRLWDVASRRQTAVFRGHTDEVWSVALSPDGKLLASGSRDQTVKLWAIGARREIATFRGHKDSIFCVAFSPDGRTLASASNDGTVRLWECGAAARGALRGAPPQRGLPAVLRGHTSWVWSVAFSPDGKILASASHDNTVKLWEVASRREVACLRGHAAPVLGVAFSPDGKNLATASDDSTIKLWETRMNQEVATLKGHTGPVMGVAFSPDGNTLATGGGDTTVRLWRAAPFAETDARDSRSRLQSAGSATR